LVLEGEEVKYFPHAIAKGGKLFMAVLFIEIAFFLFLVIEKVDLPPDIGHAPLWEGLIIPTLVGLASFFNTWNSDIERELKESEKPNEKGP
jgi:hypothetical protein